MNPEELEEIKQDSNKIERIKQLANNTYQSKEEDSDKQKKNSNRQNRDFVQIYRPFMDEMAQLGRENKIAFTLFMFIAKHMGGNNALAISMNALKETLGYSRQSISKAVKYLKDHGWLCVLKSGTTNVYILNPEIVWTSYAGQKQYCKFKTNVIVTPSENAEYLNSPKASTKYKHIDDQFIQEVSENKQKHADFTKQINQSNDNPSAGESPDVKEA